MSRVVIPHDYSQHSSIQWSIKGCRPGVYVKVDPMTDDRNRWTWWKRWASRMLLVLRFSLAKVVVFLLKVVVVASLWSIVVVYWLTDSFHPEAQRCCFFKGRCCSIFLRLIFVWWADEVDKCNRFVVRWFAREKCDPRSIKVASQFHEGCVSLLEGLAPVFIVRSNFWVGILNLVICSNVEIKPFMASLGL